MGINLNDKDVKKVVPGKDNFPKRLGGKNDRVKMVDGLEHGHTYRKDITVVYNDWTEYKTTFTILRLLEDRTVVEVKDNGGRFGTFVLNFDSLLKGCIKNKVVEQNEIYKKHMALMEDELAKKYQDDIARAKQDNINLKHAYEEQVHKNADLNEKYTKTSYALMETETKLDVINGAIEAVKKALVEIGFNKRTSKSILRTIRVLTARGTREEDIEKVVEKAINARVQEILDEILK